MYRQEDIDIITNNLDKLEDSARKIYLENYEPTFEEIDSVFEIIKNYIRNNNLIVYGGYAQNSLIKVKHPNDVFYKKIDLADIEFYSYEPLKNLIELCDILHKEGFKHAEGKEGMHPGTYKIFVNFQAYTDFSYMPKNVFDNCPTIKVEGMRMTAPHFMLVDAYRVYSDPMTSYFRLRKTFTRFTKLIEHYPFNENTVYNKIEYTINLDKKKYEQIMYFIRKKIVQKNKLIVVGHQAFNRLMKKAKMSELHFIQEPFYQLISVDYKNDRKKIYKLLKDNFKDIRYQDYHPFFQFLDKSVEFYYKKQLILRLFKDNERCIVYKYSDKKKTYFGSLQLQILYILSNYNLGIIRQNKFNQVVYLTMLTRLYKARDRYLENNNKSILDDSPFQEFTLKCIGEPKDPIRSSLLDGLKRIKQGKKVKFSYRPSGKPGKIPDYKFDNFSGNAI